MRVCLAPRLKAPHRPASHFTQPMPQVGITDTVNQLKLYTIGQPRAGDCAFAALIESKVGERWRVVNSGDPTPHGRMPCVNSCASKQFQVIPQPYSAWPSPIAAFVPCCRTC